MRAMTLIALLFCVVADAYELRGMSWAGHHYTVVRVDFGKDRLGLFNRDAKNQPFRSFSRLAVHLAGRGQRLLLAMNAGMFMTDYRPLGLYVSDGQLQRRLNTRDGTGNFYLKPNGVFLMSTHGFRIIDTDDYGALTEPPSLATQSGPLLLSRGVQNPGVSRNGVSRYIRNGVGISSPSSVWWVISDEPVTFYELTDFFRSALHCSDALYLDGHVSGMYAPGVSRYDDLYDLGPMLAVTEPMAEPVRRH